MPAMSLFWGTKAGPNSVDESITKSLSNSSLPRLLFFYAQIMTHHTLIEDDWHNRKVLIVGLGLFGGNVAATRFLSERGARIGVTDLRDETALAPSLQQLAGISLERLTLGTHLEGDLAWADTLLVSPAVKPSDPFVTTARAQGKPIVTELELFLRACPARIGAVTGSNGKSTTTTMLAHVLRASGQHVFLGGNIGHSLLSEVDQMTPEDWVALEVSSFQLAWLPDGLLRPEMAVLTNLTPNHLDWHPNFEDYVRCKARLFAWQSSSQAAILPALLPPGWPIIRARQFCYQDDHGFEAKTSSLTFPGRHNTLNALAALTSGLALGLDHEAMLRHLADMTPLAQRLETVAAYDGLTFINDSASTTPESTYEALHAMSGPLHLIVGGSDKGADFEVLANAIARRCASVALIGQLAPRLESLIGQQGHNQPVLATCHADLQSAVQWSIRQAQSRPATILLSPAAASFGLYLNYEQRGEHFNQLVRQSRER